MNIDIDIDIDGYIFICMNTHLYRYRYIDIDIDRQIHTHTHTHIYIYIYIIYIYMSVKLSPTSCRPTGTEFNPKNELNSIKIQCNERTRLSRHHTPFRTRPGPPTHRNDRDRSRLTKRYPPALSTRRD